MDIKTLKEAYQVNKTIAETEAEINSLHSLAKMVVTDDTELEFSINNLTKQRKDEESVSFDEHGSLVFGNRPSGFPSPFGLFSAMDGLASALGGNSSPYKSKKSYKINSKEFILMVEALIHYKQSKLEYYKNKLERLGILIKSK